MEPAIVQRESVAKLLLINERHQALILQTGLYAEHPEREHKPDLPGGLVDPNESERHAVVRELQEEAGIILDADSVTLGYSETKYYPDESKSVTKLLYVATIDKTPDVAISWEHEAYEWCDVTTVLQAHEFRPFYAAAIAYLQQHNLI